MHHVFAKFIAGCLALITSFHHGPKVLGDHDSRDHNSHTEKRIDLKINGQDNPAHIVLLDDVKPGDHRFVNKDIYVKDGKAKVYVHLFDLSTSQGATTEPEQKEENGIPKSDIQNYLYYDLKVGDQVIISESHQIRFPDAVSCWIPVGEVKKEKHVTMTQSFHMLISVTNWAQGDQLSFSEEFIATDPDAPTPKTQSGRIWNPTLKKCVPGVPTPTITPKPTKKPTPTPTQKYKDNDKDKDKDKNKNHNNRW